MSHNKKKTSKSGEKKTSDSPGTKELINDILKGKNDKIDNIPYSGKPSSFNVLDFINRATVTR